jgi:titin
MSGIVAGSLYTFTVSATNGRGESLPSEAISIYAATIPTAPTNLIRSSTTSKSSVTFTWSAPISNGGSPITDYSVYWDQGADNNLYVIVAPSTGNSLTYT